jgi:hypothetical protein
VGGAAGGHIWHKRSVYWPSSARQIVAHDAYTPCVTGEVRAVAHFDWTAAIMAAGVAISVIAALYIAL